MTATINSPTEEITNREFVMTPVFDAPRDLIFKAWTEPEHLAQWWGPRGFTMSVCKLELCPGGIFLYGMRTPDGHDMWGKWVFREIVAPERISFIDSFADKDGNPLRHPFAPEWPIEILSTLTFTEENGRTTLNMRAVPVNATEAERTTFEAGFDSLRSGWGGTLNQLTEYLAKIQGRKAA